MYGYPLSLHSNRWTWNYRYSILLIKVLLISSELDYFSFSCHTCPLSLHAFNTSIFFTSPSPMV